MLHRRPFRAPWQTWYLSLILAAFMVPLAGGCAGTAPLAKKAVELNHTGAEAMAKGDLETAEARFALALEYHPQFVEALTNLGLLEMQRGNLARARLQLERARRINPDLAQPHHGLGVLAERERRPDLAAENYREALKVNPGFGASRANLARILFAAGQYYDAREQFQRLVEVDPGQLAGRTGLAETLLQLGREAESDATVDRAHDDFGDTPELTILLARRAETMLLPLTAAKDDNARAAYAWIAMGRLARGDTAGALEAAERAFAFDRDDALATYVTAMAFSATHDKRAAPWLARAKLLSPRNPIIESEIQKTHASR
jgi:tetratricopeptide (TPR) repeat protein